MSRAGTNYESMQALNRSLVLQILSKKGTCSRTDMASWTGLTQASISKIVAEMIDAGIVVEGGRVSGMSGKRSIGISINQYLCKVLAVKIARKSFDVAAFWLNGDLIERSHRVVNISKVSPYKILEAIKNEIKNYLDKYADICAIGVAVPGPYLRKEGRIAIMSEVSGWDKLNIYEDLSEEFDLPIRMEHDANASAFAEWRYGENYGYGEKGTLVSLLTSEGVGAGIVNNGEIFRGIDGVAGEVGHMSIDMNGPRCICGNYGCLELYTSALSFAKFVKEDLKAHPDSTLNREEQITAETVFEHMRMGDTFSTEEVKKVGRYIGQGMANIIYLYNPQEIIMTDIMTGGGDVLLDAAKEVVRERTISELHRDIRIRMTTLKYDSILMGAAALATDLLLDNPSSLFSFAAKSAAAWTEIGSL